MLDFTPQCGLCEEGFLLSSPSDLAAADSDSPGVGAPCGTFIPTILEIWALDVPRWPSSFRSAHGSV
eukprot:2682974-Amphidinium_carterae.2